MRPSIFLFCRWSLGQPGPTWFSIWVVLLRALEHMLLDPPFFGSSELYISYITHCEPIVSCHAQRTIMGFRPRWIAGTIPAASSRYLVRKKGTCSFPTLSKTPKTRSFFANSVVNLCLPYNESKTYLGMPFSNSTTQKCLCRSC